MKARIQNGIVVEFLHAIPGYPFESCFHPSILAQCVDFVEGMEIGQPPPPAAPTEPPSEEPAQQ